MNSPKIKMNSTISRSFKVLDDKDRIKLGFAVILQTLMSILDLVGVLLIGILGAVTVNGLQGGATGDRVNRILSFLGIQNSTLQKQALVLGCLAASVLISRTLFSIYFIRRILYFLSNKGASLTSKLVFKVLSQSLTAIKEKSNQEILYACTVGVQTITLGILGILAVIISDSFLLIVMVLGLFLVDPIVALCTLAIFLVIGSLLNKLMHKRAIALGKLSADLNIKSNTKIIEVLSTYRESVVRNRRAYYAHHIGQIRHQLANANAELTFMPNVSKYVIEGTLIAGTLFICGIQFALNSAVHAIGVLTLFLAAGSRIAPAVLRMQQSIILIKSNLGSAEPTLNLIESISSVNEKAIWRKDIDVVHEGFLGEVSMKDITVQYPGSKYYALHNVNVEIKFGDVIAIVGPSGAGKTTFVDTLLGIVEPKSGEVRISGQRPLKAIETWPGAMAYVPQDVSLIDGTIRENITLGFDPLSIDVNLINNSLSISQLAEFIDSLPDKLETKIGDGGIQLSGGQRQRIGIARATLSKPALLVLDEATSSLDADTEQSISKAIASLKGKVTVIIIAHRLSTVRDADKVLYFENGEILSSGTFNYVRSQVLNFDKQAKLMGL